MSSTYRLIRHSPNTIAIHEASCNDNGDILRIYGKPIVVGGSIPDLLQSLKNMHEAFDFLVISSDEMDGINYADRALRNEAMQRLAKFDEENGLM
jgi:hypothetical protein